MSDKPSKTPLAELLVGISKDARMEEETQWAEDGTPTGHALIPVGRLMHEAADEISRLQSNLKIAAAVIGMAKRKLEIYREYSDGSYHGGVEHTVLIKTIDETLSKLTTEGEEDE